MIWHQKIYQPINRLDEKKNHVISLEERKYSKIEYSFKEKKSQRTRKTFLLQQSHSPKAYSQHPS